MKPSKARRLVVKIGSSILTDDGQVRAEWLAGLVEDLADVRKNGTQLIIVSSGAVALGRAVLGVASVPMKLEEKQAAAACGQILLMKAWREQLQPHGMQAAQLLLTPHDSDDRRRYLNARNTLETLLQHQIVPVINENDTVATAELRFGDNDRLAARVAQMASADMLVLLSDIDGLYTANPHVDTSATLVREVDEITPAIEAMAGAATSSVGSGGMITKIQAAKIALAAGCHMAIAAGKGAHPLKALEETSHGTWFIASSTPLSARKHWIGGAIVPMGVVVVDDGAVSALAQGKSLLPAGVKAVEGRFSRGDAIEVRTLGGQIIGKGLSAYSSEDALRVMGQRSENIEQILGFKGRSALIHRDDLVMSTGRA
jgi:glutamate 5-kinase